MVLDGIGRLRETPRMSLGSARCIDLHAHVVLEETLGAAGALGPELLEVGGAPCFRVGDYRLEGVRYRGSPFMDPALRLARMDEAGIDYQLLSPNPLSFLHHAPAEIAVAFCRRHNDALAALVAAQPQRLGGLAALPMQCPSAASEELERATRELGLLGAGIGTDFAGLALDAPELDAFYASAVRLDAPLFLHPAPAGIDGPPGDARLRRFDLDLVIGFAAEETLAVATLIYGGVLERHPALDLCISHGGGAAPYLAGRLAAAARKRPWASAALRADGAFEAQLARLWFDVHVHDARSLALLEAVVGRERLVLGTNFAGWDAGDAAVLMQGRADLADNARRLLRGTPRAEHGGATPPRR